MAREVNRFSDLNYCSFRAPSRGDGSWLLRSAWRRKNNHLHVSFIRETAAISVNISATWPHPQLAANRHARLHELLHVSSGIHQQEGQNQVLAESSTAVVGNLHGTCASDLRREARLVSRVPQAALEMKALPSVPARASIVGYQGKDKAKDKDRDKDWKTRCTRASCGYLVIFGTARLCLRIGFNNVSVPFM